jgi:hypothetical protein
LFLQGSGDQSQELYTFHEAVSQLNDIEDNIVDDHKSSIEVNTQVITSFVIKVEHLID